jgi:hypothetical protein
MPPIRRAIALGTILTLVATGASAIVFETGVDFQKFVRKSIGSLGNAGKARKACVCRDAGNEFNAAGFLDVRYDAATNYFTTRCLAPHPSTEDGFLSPLTICVNFLVIP